MSQIIREYVKSYLSLIQEDRASTRSARALDADTVLYKLEAYFSSKGKKLEQISKAKQGSKGTDLEVRITSLRSPAGQAAKDSWAFEVKSFSSDTELRVEMTNPNSEIRKVVLRDDMPLSSEKNVKDQLEAKLSSNLKAIVWASEALKSTDASFWSGSVVIPGDKDPRTLKVTAGEVGDWGRLRAAGLRPSGKIGQYRSFYTTSNVNLKTLEKDFYDTAALELAIQNEFTQKGDEVLVLYGGATNTLRCFSLSDEAEAAFGFPMFNSGGNTIKQESTSVTSFGGAGRIGIVCEVEEDSGTLIK